MTAPRGLFIFRRDLRLDDNTGLNRAFESCGEVIAAFVLDASFHEVYQALEWRDDEGDFARWREGRTGFPIVDAGMRELEATGFMHNRDRMIVASFLTKDLHLDWRWGERHFATRLTDYDPSVNNGSWQWSASTGCDAQPYFRDFNPLRQTERFDPECRYIKRWIPELSELSAKRIHALESSPPPKGIDYPLPMVIHKIEAQKATLLYKRARGRASSLPDSPIICR